MRTRHRQVRTFTLACTHWKQICRFGSGVLNDAASKSLTKRLIHKHTYIHTGTSGTRKSTTPNWFDKCAGALAARRRLASRNQTVHAQIIFGSSGDTRDTYDPDKFGARRGASKSDNIDCGSTNLLHTPRCVRLCASGCSASLGRACVCVRVTEALRHLSRPACMSSPHILNRYIYAEHYACSVMNANASSVGLRGGWMCHGNISLIKRVVFNCSNQVEVEERRKFRVRV